MAKFIQKNPLIFILIIVFLAIVIGAAGYFLLIRPRKATIENKEKEFESVNQEIETEKITNKKLLETKNKAAEYEAKLAKLDAVIPQDPQLPQLIRNLQAAADPGTGAGLPWLSFSPSEISSGGGGAGYSTYTFSMTVVGYYDEVTDLVYRMERFARAVIIDSVNITTTTSIIGWEQIFSGEQEIYVPYVVLVETDPETGAVAPVEYVRRVPDPYLINENDGYVQAEISAKTFTYASPQVGERTEGNAASQATTQPESSGTQSTGPAVQKK